MNWFKGAVSSVAHAVTNPRFLETAGGTLEAGAGAVTLATTGWTGLGAVAGYALVGQGSLTAAQGIQGYATGHAQRHGVTSQILRARGASQGWADGVDTGVNLALTVAGPGLSSARAIGTAASLGGKLAAVGNTAWVGDGAVASARTLLTGRQTDSGVDSVLRQAGLSDSQAQLTQMAVGVVEPAVRGVHAVATGRRDAAEPACPTASATMRHGEGDPLAGTARTPTAPPDAAAGPVVAIVAAHPDDETSVDTLMKGLPHDTRFQVFLLNLGAQSTRFLRDPETGIPTPAYDEGTGKEQVDPKATILRREADIRRKYELAGLGDRVQITILHGNADRNPWRDPALRIIRYAQAAGWDLPHLHAAILARLERARLVALVSMMTPPGDHPAEVPHAASEIHPAHSETGRITEALADARERLFGTRPAEFEIEEAGWYPELNLPPVDASHSITRELDAAEVRAKQAELAAAYPDEPPGFPFFNEAGFERLRASPRTTSAQIDAFRRLLAARPTTAAIDDQGQPGSAARAGGSPKVEHVAARGPERLREPRGRAQGVPPAPAKSRPLAVGTLTGFAERAARFVRDESDRPRWRLTQEERAQRDYHLNAPARHVPTRTSSRQRVELARSDVGGFWRGADRNVVFHLHSDRDPETVFTADGALPLDDRTRIWTSSDGARGGAAPEVGATGQPRFVYRGEAPPRRIRQAVDARRIGSGLLVSGAAVIDDEGVLGPETVVNPHARHAPRPGETYTAPARRGTTAGEVRRGAAKAAATLAATAAGSYAGVRWGWSGGGGTVALHALADTGLAAFGIRSSEGAVKAFVANRFGNRVDDARPGAQARQPDSAFRGALARATGLRGGLRGLSRSDRDAIALAGQVFQANPRDADAFRVLEGAPERLFSRDSGLEQGLSALRALTFGQNNANNLANFVRNVTGHSLQQLVNLGFTLVHPSNEGADVWARHLARAAGDEQDPTVVAAGETLRPWLTGNSERPAWLRTVHGLGDRQAVTYDAIRPDEGPWERAPGFARLKEAATGGATALMLPFMSSDVLAQFAAGRPGVAALQVAADWWALRGFHGAYLDTFRANRGLGPLVRRNRVLSRLSDAGRIAPGSAAPGPRAVVARSVSWIARGLQGPARGASAEPTDPSNPLLADHGLLRTQDPRIVLGAGMGARVVTGFIFPANAPSPTSNDRHRDAPAPTPAPLSGLPPGAAAEVPPDARSPITGKRRHPARAGGRVVVEAGDPRRDTLWGIAHANERRLLTKAQAAAIAQAGGGRNAETRAALDALIRRNPQYPFGRGAGDDDTIQPGWVIDIES